MCSCTKKYIDVRITVMVLCSFTLRHIYMKFYFFVYNKEFPPYIVYTFILFYSKNAIES